MDAHHLTTLYDYNHWANALLMDTAALLSPTELMAPAPFPFGNAHTLLSHIVGAEQVWLSRWQGISPSALPSAGETPDMAALRARWLSHDRALRVFIASLSGQASERTIRYTNTRGQAFAYPLWQMAVHLVNHGTQHRAELAALLTMAGHSPGDIDFIRYLAELPSGRA